jgi:tellurite resistance protein TerC
MQSVVELYSMHNKIDKDKSYLLFKDVYKYYNSKKGERLQSNPMLIVVFAIAIIIMLLLDLGVFNKKSHEVSNKEAVIWSVVWISLAMVFSSLIYMYAGSVKFFEFQSAYWIEKSLSVDNLFVFIMVFKFFDVANQNKHKVLFWGIIGALVLRAIFIFSGIVLSFTAERGCKS